MACRYVDATLCSELSDGERDFRCRAEALEEIALDAVGGEDGSDCLCKQSAVVAAVVAYNGCEVCAAWECFVYIVGEALCCHAYDVFVHAVGAGSHDAAQAACAELERAIERFDESCRVGVVEHGLNFLTCCLVK